jgi:hypothetical protein
MPICNHCLEEKKPEEFNWRYKALGVRHPTCKECPKPFRKNWYEGDAHARHLANVKERQYAAREAAQNFIYEYLAAHPCEQCGESDIRVLEFHHNGGKDKAVSTMVSAGYSVGRIDAEIRKCSVLCSNCHRKITVEERGWFKGKR